MVESALPSLGAMGPVAQATAPREPPLVLQTMRRLLRDIFNGVYGPGDRIREVEVAERYGVSRAPVREALRVLDQDGMIELTPWHGARVIDPRPEEMADLLDLLGIMLGAVARLAARHATTADLRLIAQDVKAAEKAAQARRPAMELVDLAYRTGAHLGRCSGSPQAAALLRRAGRPAYWLHRFLEPVPTRWRDQSIARYRKLLDALMARSEVRAEKAARRMVQHTRNLVLSRAVAVQKTAGPQPRMQIISSRGGSQ